MLNVSEVTGAWTIPFGIDLGNTFWDVINSTGLFLIPFSMSIAGCWLKARSAGQDDGSSAVMFIKLLEKSWLSMFFCMYLFVIPSESPSYVPDSYTTSDGSTTTFSAINFKIYSCRGDQSTILESDTTSGNISPNLPFSQSLDTSLPLLFGLANEMFQGFTQALNAEIPCDEDMNAAYLMSEAVAFSANGDDDVQYSAKQFINQCYLPAMKNLSTSIGNGLHNDGVMLDAEERWFNSTHLLAAYSGTVSLSDTEQYSPLYMPYDSDRWSGTGGGDDLVSSTDGSDDIEDKVMSCTSAQTQIYSVIASDGGELDSHYSELVTKAKTTEKAYPNKDGAYNSTSDILNKYSHQYLMDVTGNVAGMFNVNFSANANLTQKREQDLFGDVVSRTTTLFSELSNNITNYTLNIGGSVLVSVLISMIFVSAPIVLTLSGYSFKVASGLVYTLAFLIGTSYVLDLGWYIETVIMTLITSSYSIYITDPVAIDGDVPLNLMSMMSYVQSSVVVTLLGVWSLMGGFLGVMVIPVFSQTLNTFSSSVGEHGAKVAEMAIKMAVKMLPTKLPMK